MLWHTNATKTTNTLQTTIRHWQADILSNSHQKMEEVRNKRVVLKRHVVGLPSEGDMEVVSTGTTRLAVPEGREGVVVKNLYLSCDPYMRCRMNMHDLVPGQVITGYGVAKVLKSTHEGFRAGDFVWGFVGWEEYSFVENAKSLSKIKFDDLPLSYYVGILGVHGLVAYAGFHKICSPKKGEFVFVSAASGAVGQLVGQFAKQMECYVVGSAGSDHKVNLMKEKFGFDEGFNYKKEQDLEATLRRHFPQGIDIYFDNVGGSMLDAVLPNMRTNGRIALCGMASQYNLEKPEGVCNLFCVVSKRVRMQGFLVLDYLSFYPEFESITRDYIKQGKLVYVEDIDEGIEKAPSALVGVFSGRNVGKKLVKVSQ